MATKLDDNRWLPSQKIGAWRLVMFFRSISDNRIVKSLQFPETYDHRLCTDEVQRGERCSREVVSKRKPEKTRDCITKTKTTPTKPEPSALLNRRLTSSGKNYKKKLVRKKIKFRAKQNSLCAYLKNEVILKLCEKLCFSPLWSLRKK